ncbi:MAG: prepilin peptidase [Pseudomonadota bacterium]
MAGSMALFRPSDHATRVEGQDRSPGGLERFFGAAFGRVTGPFASRLGPYRRFVSLVHDAEDGLDALDDAALRDRALELKLELRRHGIDSDPHVAKAFALVREAAGRSLGMRHFDSQIIGGRVLLAGKVAEMATGEGKTLTATLTAATAAIAGIPVHVITANDYLAVRDCEEMSPVYELLGLSVGIVSKDTQQDARRSEYARDITYCTNADVAFDYLRDTITLQSSHSNVKLQAEYLHQHASRKHRLNLRGLHFAIVDEADSVLIDDARTPLIISANRGGEAEERFLREAWQLASELEADTDYVVDRQLKSIFLLDAGSDRLDRLSTEKGPLWLGRIRREEAIRKALAVRYFYNLDEHYVVVDGKVQIVDENTGRILPDRSWERGLHQLIEIKEGVDVSKQRETLARISYQRFFRRYLRLAGMTGTAREVRPELWDVYRLRSVSVPTHKRLRREALKTHVVADDEQHRRLIVDAVRQVHDEGRPVLIGTATVAASEQLSRDLEREGIAHRLLNAKQDDQEARIVAEAGGQGAVTVATQMAGRGTDIKLSEAVESAGGLHVIVTQLYDAARIDRQLAGRCARMGDRGSTQKLLSLQHIDGRNVDLRWLSRSIAPLLGTPLGRLAARALLKRNQRRIEDHHARVRRAVFRQDERERELLALSGRSE